MANLSDSAQKIAQLTKEAKNQNNHPNYKKIIEVYESEIKNQFLKDEIIKNEFLIKNVFNAYKGLSKHEDAAVFVINQLNYKLTPNMDSYFLSSFGWNLFFMLKNATRSEDEDDIETSVVTNHQSNLKISKEDLLEYLTSLLKLLNTENPKDANLRVRVLFQFIKYEKSNSTPDWAAINDLLEYINPGSLDNTPQTITIKNGPKAGREIELATDLENWYSYKTKALIEIEHYLDCIKVCEQALKLIQKFHYDNEIWIKRRIAICKLRLGETSEGINLLFDVLLNKKEWFIFKEYAEEILKTGDLEKARKYAIDAALMKGDYLLRLDLFRLIAEILNKLNEPDLAKKHHFVELLLRTEKKWRIPEYLEPLQAELAQLNPVPTSKAMLEELKKYWHSFLQSGTIKRILHDKRLGWIKGTNKEYFFRFSVVDGAVAKLKEGDRVKFSACPGMNKVKNTLEEDAIYVVAE
jgi:cold shock CspA family protein